MRDFNFRFRCVPDGFNAAQLAHLGVTTMFKQGIQLFMALVGLSVLQSVRADLPTPLAPSTAPPAGDWIGLIQG